MDFVDLFNEIPGLNYCSYNNAVDWCMIVFLIM